MGTTRRIFVAVAVAALTAASAAAYAQAGGRGYGCPGMGAGGPGMGPGMMGPGAGWGPRGGGFGPGAGPGAAQRGFGPGAAAGAGPRGFGPGANAGAVADARLAYLKAQLKITPEQTAAWDAYSAAVKKHAEQMQGFRTAMVSTQSADDRLTLHTEFVKQRAATIESRNDATRELYSALTADQKAAADLHMGGMRLGQAGRGPGRWRQ